MKKNGIGSRIISMLLVLVMVLSVLPVSSFAAKGDKINGDNGLKAGTDIDTSKTISLPIKIFDYKNDGMLFDFAESPIGDAGVWARSKNVAKPSFSVGTDYTLGKTAYSAVAYSNMSYASGKADVGNTEDTLNYLNWSKDTANAGCLSVFDLAAEGHSKTRYKVSDIRYMALVYRSAGGSNSTSVQFDMWDYTDNKRTSKVTTSIDNRGTTWRYVVVDLGTIVSKTSNEVTAVYGYLPKGIGVAYAAYFPTQAAADNFGKAALAYTGETYQNTGDNRGFGLLRYSRNTAYGSNTTDDNIANKHAEAGIFTQNTSADTPFDTSSLNFGYSYNLKNIMTGGIATLGMLESELVNGYPVYKQATVEYVANLLKDSLAIPEYDSGYGYKNYSFVKGAADSRYGGVDFAQWLRNKNLSLGTYSATKAKGAQLIGTWESVSGNISSYMDAAYFMLNSIFYAGSYNTVMEDYSYLVLSEATNSDGKLVHVFDSSFADNTDVNAAKSAVSYNEDKDTISNTTGKAKTYYSLNTDNTNLACYFPFLPIVDQNGNNTNGTTVSPYFQDDGVAFSDTAGILYKGNNFNYALVSEGEFVFCREDDQYFYFEGDDDVYLFVDNKLVLDIGCAHGITKSKVKLNDYADIFGWIDGDTYPFKFFYMERHGVGANMRIETNIPVTDPEMVTEKTAWQDGNPLEFGSIVNKDGFVEYGFAIENKGNTNLYNLTFDDQDIGVKLDPSNGLTIAAAKTSNVKDINGETLTASDLTALITCPGYDDINITFADNDALKKFLEDLTAAGTEAGGGLYAGAKVLIRGIGYKLTDAQVSAGVFDNTVYTTATDSLGEENLRGFAKMRVFVPADPMYYEWAGHNLSVNKTKLIEDILAAANQPDNILADKVPNLETTNVNKIELTNKQGTAITSENVKIDGSYNLTINYPTPGSKVFYVKVTYNSSKNSVIVPVLVNVTDVKDSVFVLDYGLKVNLNDGTELFKNDAITVPGRPTNSGIIAIGSNGAYSPNEITFTQNNDVTGSYGKFNFSDSIFSYTPNAFMEGVDQVQIAMNVYESDATPSKISGTLDINNEVEMYKSVSVLPANVVYYEDDFPAIKYKKDNTSASDDTFVKLGTTQSNNQDEEYGHDDRYENATSDEISGNSLTTITINDNTTAAYFFFKGTGLELISRTNATDSGKLALRIYNASDVDANGNILNSAKPIKDIPVITEFDHNDDGGSEAIYQVPVIRVNDLPLDENGQAKQYAVLISGVPTRDYTQTGDDGKPRVIPTNLYIDGLRIYQPGEGNADIENNYDADEKDARFIELRKQIVDGKVAVGSYTEDSGLEINTALHTWTEDHDGKLISNEVETVEDYLLRGPNNEVYVTGTYDNAALIFYVKDTNANAVSSLQIALRAIDENLFFSGNETGAKATVLYGTGTGWAEVVTDMTSSTEQYFTIDLSKCPVTDMGYQVVVQVKEGMVSFSSLKLTGLELHTIGEAFGEIAFINGIWYKNFEADVDPAQLEPLSDDEFVNISGIKEQLAAPYVPEEEVPETEPTEPVAPKPVKPTKPVTPFDPSDIFGGDYFSRHQQIKKMLQWINSWMGR